MTSASPACSWSSSSCRSLGVGWLAPARRHAGIARPQPLRRATRLRSGLTRREAPGLHRGGAGLCDSPEMTETGTEPDPVAILKALDRLPLGHAGGGRRARLSRAGCSAGAGFTVERLAFAAPGTPDVENLFATHRQPARRTSSSPAIPTWCRPATRRAGRIRPSPARSPAAALRPRRRRHEGRHRRFRRGGARLPRREAGRAGTLSLLITGDEEGPAVNGTVKLIEWAREARPPLRRGPGRRADLAGAARRHDQDRPARQPVRHDPRRRARRATSPTRISPTTRSTALVRMARPADPRRGSTTAAPTSSRRTSKSTSIDVGNPAFNVIPARGAGALQHPLQRPLDADRLEALAEARDWTRRPPAARYELDRRAGRERLVPDPLGRADRPARRGDRGRDRRRRPSSPPAAAPRMRASSRTSARWSSSGSSATPCTRSTNACRSPISAASPASTGCFLERFFADAVPRS